VLSTHRLGRLTAAGEITIGRILIVLGGLLVLITQRLVAIARGLIRVARGLITITQRLSSVEQIEGLRMIGPATVTMRATVSDRFGGSINDEMQPKPDTFQRQ
jgi:hypothetical protein